MVKLMFNSLEKTLYPNAWQECEPTGHWKLEESEGDIQLYLNVNTQKGWAYNYKLKDITKRRLFPFLYLIPTTKREVIYADEREPYWYDCKWVHERDLKIVKINEFYCGG